MDLIPGLPDDVARQCLIRLDYSQLSRALLVCNSWKGAIQSDRFLRQRISAGLTRALLVLSQADPAKPVGCGSASKAAAAATPSYGLTVFDPDSGEWSRLPPPPEWSGNGLPLFCECVGVGRRVLVVGGWAPATFQPSRSVHVYDFVTAAWTRGEDMPGPARSFFACAAAGDGRTVVVAGGHDEEKNALRSALSYDVESGEWTQLADMAVPRDECKGVFRDGAFCVIGGYRTESQGRFERSAEAYDVATATWRLEEEVLEEEGACPRTCAAVESSGGRLFRCRGDHLVAAAAGGGEWMAAAEIPGNVRVGSYLVTWRNRMMVIGSGGHGQAYSCHVAEVGSGDRYTWREVEKAVEFSGHVYSGCTIEV
ncbi:hypothetical protein Syun_011261 [Stephania yunnanensis]|uniref:F-box domain-containing protein n=1 Tax=Stephania yunnanensis TaxID=152371 RepID=A0AAP0JX73_9MAGN